ncbi:coiled-coil domain-containing protein 40 [Brachionichthys hirsutus]|uniref:coiled-coil domain-containing protein 40 n=1 Tax=Brachionichthys hirsutus TaxID=412623 RepID=UPI00360460A1
MVGTTLQRTAERRSRLLSGYVACGFTPIISPMSGPEPDNLSTQLHPARCDPAAAADSEAVAQEASRPHLLTHEISEEPLPEEEEMTILDSEHPLVRKMQAALSTHLRKKLENKDLELKEKLARDKSGEGDMKEMHAWMFGVQEQLARRQSQLEDLHLRKTQAEAKRQQAQDQDQDQDQLKERKAKFNSTTRQHKKDKASVSQLQTEFDGLMLQLVLTRRLSEGLHADVKATQTRHHKTGAEKNHVEEQKRTQDFYVERLRKTLEKLMQQIAMCDAQARAQAEERQDVRKSLSEAETELECLHMKSKRLQQLWSGSLRELGKGEESFSVMQEAARSANQQLIFLEKQIKGYKKSTREEQEKHETLTMQRNLSQTACDTLKKLISENQADQDALKAQHSTCLRTVREMEHTVARLSKEASTHQAHVNDQRRQLEKEIALCLELEDKIMTCMQEVLIRKKDVKYSQSHITEISRMKKEKCLPLCQLENDIGRVALEHSMVEQQLKGLDVTLGARNEQIAERNKLLTSAQDEIASFSTLIDQKQHMIASYKTKIEKIAARAGHEDLNPLETKVQELNAQIDELEGKIKSEKQLWMMQQGTLLGLTQEEVANSRETLRVQTACDAMNWRSMRLESQKEIGRREMEHLDNVKRELLKVINLQRERDWLNREEEDDLMETNFCRLKEAERESLEMSVNLKEIQEEKQTLRACLEDAERHVILWKKLVQLQKGTCSAEASFQEETQMMKDEVDRKERRLDQLMKQQQQLLRASEATVLRMENLDLCGETMKTCRSPRQPQQQLERSSIFRGLQQKIWDAHKNALESDKVIKELQEKQVSVKDELRQNKQQLIELHLRNPNLDCEIVNLREVEDANQTHLVAPQNQNESLEEPCKDTYRTSSAEESVGSLLQSQMERIHAVRAILQRVCEDFPQFRGMLRQPMLALELHQNLEE